MFTYKDKIFFFILAVLLIVNIAFIRLTIRHTSTHYGKLSAAVSTPINTSKAAIASPPLCNVGITKPKPHSQGRFSTINF